MKTTTTTVALKDLVLSPLNVRTHVDDATDIDQLAASIATVGLIQPIGIHKLKKGKKYGVVAGGRRLRALEHLLASGACDPDQVALDPNAIPAVLLEGSDAELVEASLTENYVRVQMRTPEVYKAFKAIRDKDPKISDAELGKHFGYDEKRVARIMRLAFLHPDIFNAYAQGHITDEMARAFAATTDHDLQLSVWKQVKGLEDWQRSARQIRQLLGLGDRALSERLKVVGLETYRAEGGRFEVDLFATDETDGRIVDPDLLNRLYLAKVEASYADWLKDYPRPDEVTMVMQHPVEEGRGYIPYQYRVTAESSLPAEVQAELDALRDRIDAAQDAYEQLVDYDAIEASEIELDDDPILPGQEAEAERLCNEVQKLAAEDSALRNQYPPEYPEGPKFAVPEIHHGGALGFTLYWQSEPRIDRATGTVTASPAAPPPAEEEGIKLSQRAIDTMKVMRRNMLVRFLAEDFAAENRTMARDALIFSLGRRLVMSYDSHEARLGLVIGFAGSGFVGAGTGEPQDQLPLEDIPGLADKDPVAGFSAYVFEASDEQKDRLAAAVWLSKVDGVLYQEGRRTVAEWMGTTLHEPIMARRYWKPTVAFFDLFKKATILDWIGNVAKQLRIDRAKDKVGDLKANAAALFTADDKAVKRFGLGKSRSKAETWLPEWLQWNKEVALTDPKDARVAAAESAQEGDGEAGGGDAPDEAGSSPPDGAEAGELGRINEHLMEDEAAQ